MIPFWVVRICFMIIIIGFYAWALHYAANRTNPPTIAVIVVFMLLLFICLLLDVLAIVQFARDALKPTSFLIYNVVQSGIWLMIIILDVVAIARGAAWSGLIGSIVVFLSFVGLLIYAFVGWRRDRANRNRGQYVPAVNPAYPQVQPQQFGYTGAAAPPTGTTYYPQSATPAELHSPAPPPFGAASEYYSGASQPAPVNPFKDPHNPFQDPHSAGHTQHGGSFA